MRLYYLPTSRWVVNLELLPDVPVEGPTPEGLNRVLGAIGAAWKRRDKVGAAEARAQFAAIERELKSFAPRHTVAAGEPVGADVLATALIGTWSSPFLTIHINGDGSLTVWTPDGDEQSGRWSVGPNGRLNADVFGGPHAFDASIAGDALTLVVEGQSIKLRRASTT